ncbi:hypothetical protein ABLG96_02855 [Nakamurella sp. A5-74]|uniref:Uncharacterized protein n=1 Tax=Nakamurella sp. A5-74 TaxID=3158264 RepID=A0AAU8DPU4_9ACTN
MSQTPSMNAPYGQQPEEVDARVSAELSARRANLPAGTLQIIGGAVAIVAAFLSWASLRANSVSISVNGMGDVSGLPAGAELPETNIGDGWFVIGAGAVAALGGVLLVVLKQGALSVLGLIGGLGVLGLGVYELVQIETVIGRFEALGSGASGAVGIGIWLLIAGGAVTLIGVDPRFGVGPRTS